MQSCDNCKKNDNIRLKGGHPSLTLFFQLVTYMQYQKKDQIQIRDNSQANCLRKFNEPRKSVNLHLRPFLLTYLEHKISETPVFELCCNQVAV